MDTTTKIYVGVVLAALLVEYLVGLVAELCNLRALAPEPPPELRGKVDPATYRRSQEYTRARTRLGLVRRTFHLAVLFAFWALGGFGWLDEATRALELAPVPTGLVFLGVLTIARSCLDLPFQIVGTFRIEERFGFNRTTPRTFVLDRVKGLLLTVLLGGPLVGGVLWLFHDAGSTAWLWAWLVTIAFLLVVQLLAPTWILPLFNRFRPIGDQGEEGELARALREYARSVAFPLDEIFVIDGSRRSTKSNAFFTGLGKRKRIALFDTLIEDHTADELLAVVAHEVGHYQRRHVVKGLVASVLHTGATLFVLSLFLDNAALFAAFGVSEPSVHGAFVFFGLLFTPLELVLGLGFQAWSRRHEYEADAFASETTGRPDVLARALEKLAVRNLSNLTPHPLHVWLYHSHPPVLERIAALGISRAR